MEVARTDDMFVLEIVWSHGQSFNPMASSWDIPTVTSRILKLTLLLGLESTTRTISWNKKCQVHEDLPSAHHCKFPPPPKEKKTWNRQQSPNVAGDIVLRSNIFWWMVGHVEIRVHGQSFLNDVGSWANWFQPLPPTKSGPSRNTGEKLPSPEKWWFGGYFPFGKAHVQRLFFGISREGKALLEARRWLKTLPFIKPRILISGRVSSHEFRTKWMACQQAKEGVKRSIETTSRTISLFSHLELLRCILNPPNDPVAMICVDVHNILYTWYMHTCKHNMTTCMYRHIYPQKKGSKPPQDGVHDSSHFGLLRQARHFC